MSCMTRQKEYTYLNDQSPKRLTYFPPETGLKVGGQGLGAYTANGIGAEQGEIQGLGDSDARSEVGCRCGR